MSIALKYEFLKVIRNKRFLILSVLTPLMWFVMIMVFAPKATKNSQDYVLSMAILCIMFSTIGSYINTLSSRINREKKYIRITVKTTPFNALKYVLTSCLVQMVIGFLIAFFIILFAIIVFGMHLSPNILLACASVLYSGIFYILIGFCLGYLLEPGTLQVLSFPLFIIIGILALPQEEFTLLPQSLGNIQKLTPCYYAGRWMYNIAEGVKFSNSIIDVVVITIAIIVMIFITTFIFNSKKQNKYDS